MTRLNLDLPAYQVWLQRALEARSYQDNDFHTLKKFGIDFDSNRPWIKSNAIHKVINMLEGRAFSNPIKAKAEPYEGFNLEEDVSKICACVWQHEERARRGPRERNLLQEIRRTVNDGLWTGRMCYDARIETTLQSTLYPRGMPLYERLAPENVVLDARAARLQDVRHLFVVSSYTEEEAESVFEIPRGTIAGRRGRILPHPLYSFNFDSNLVEVVETQYQKVFLDYSYILPAPIASLLNWPEKEGFEVYLSDLQRHVQEQAAREPRLQDIKPEEIAAMLQDYPRERVQRWGVFCTYFFSDGESAVKEKEYYLGNRFTILLDEFFPASNSPYGLGVPYFLNDLQMMNILVKSTAAKLLMRANKIRVHVRESLNQATKNQLSDDLAPVIEYMGQLSEDRPMSDQIVFESAGEAMPWLIQFSQLLDRDFHSTYGTHQSDQTPYAGAPAKMVNTLLAAGNVMFANFRLTLNDFLPRIYERALFLAVRALPKEVLMLLAGENDEDRMRLIQTGEFKARISLMNIAVNLDLTDEAERLMQKQIFGDLLAKDAVDPETGLTQLGVDEPRMLAQRIMDWRLSQNEALALGTQIISDPILKQEITGMIQRYQQQLQTIKQIKKLGAIGR